MICAVNTLTVGSLHVGNNLAQGRDPAILKRGPELCQSDHHCFCFQTVNYPQFMCFMIIEASFGVLYPELRIGNINCG